LKLIEVPAGTVEPKKAFAIVNS